MNCVINAKGVFDEVQRVGSLNVSIGLDTIDSATSQAYMDHLKLKSTHRDLGII